MKKQIPPFIYFYRSARGPGIGCQPNGADTRKTGMINTVTLFGKRTFWGEVEYPTALHPQQIYDYELWPQSEVQFAIWKAWEQMNEAGCLWVYESYKKAILDELDYDTDNPPVIDLPDRFAKDTTAMVVKILIENDINITELEAILG